MSVLFGEWNIDGKPVEPEMVSAADEILAPYAPDALSHYEGAGFVFAYHAFHTTAESRREKQPFVAASGIVLTWDGRLDNREELISELRNGLTNEATDVEIVAAAFDRWGTACFAKILGDWAVAIWNPHHKQLVLAKDFAGIRPLYYTADGREVRWSSLLDPLVTLARKRFQLNGEYAAGWLAMYPAAHATPYIGVHAVPPCSFVTVDSDKVATAKYWDFDPVKRIRYRTDAEYEEHFRSAFGTSVTRRLRTDRPICCELSGGMDSPSITCMADMIRRNTAGVPDIYTMSFYDDHEPHGDERPYFSKVEEKLGRTGCHIDIGDGEIFRFEESRFIPLPASVARPSSNFVVTQTNYLKSNRVRVVLSGIGGDEMTGGVPSPIAELQDLIARGELRQLANKLKLWALAKRKPWFHLAGEALAGFVPIGLVPQPKFLRPASWLQQPFAQRYREPLSGFNHRVTFSGALPSLQANLDALEVVRRQLATMSLTSNYPHERRYPFLDRSLLEFIFAIPREQILRPGYRRSLLRRAMKGIVPAEVLERRRKAYASRGPRAAITTEWERVSSLCQNTICAQLLIIDDQKFQSALLESRNNDQSPLVQLMRTVILEAWLRNVVGHKFLATMDKYQTRDDTVKFRTGGGLALPVGTEN